MTWRHSRSRRIVFWRRKMETWRNWRVRRRAWSAGAFADGLAEVAVAAVGS